MPRIIVPFAVGIFAAAGLAGIASAQQLQEVTVQASLQVQKNLVGYAYGGIPIEDASISLGVSYAGLDLVSNAGVVELQKRVNDAAERACKELDRQFAVSTSSDEQDCVRQTVDNATTQVDEVIAEAAKSAGK